MRAYYPQGLKIKANKINVNSIIREKTGLKQWRNTDSVIAWFKKIEKKSSKKFIQFDVVNFYPSISAELLKAAIQWARQFVDVSTEQERIIMESKKSLIFRKGNPGAKKEIQNLMLDKEVLMVQKLVNW